MDQSCKILPLQSLNKSQLESGQELDELVDLLSEILVNQILQSDEDSFPILEVF